MDLVNDLSALGFTEYEAKVYLALLKDHPATGYQLSKQAGIPRSMVYEALGRLDARGAVLKSEEDKATLYRPMPPDALLDRLRDEHRRRIRKLRAGLNALYTARDEGYLWTFTGQASILSYAQNMLTYAQHEAMLVLTDFCLDYLHETLVEAHKRGVHIGALLTGVGQLDVGEVTHHPPRESQLHRMEDSLVVVVDEQEALIASIHADDASATVTTNTNMVQVSRQFVWMELFAHRVFSQLGPEMLAQLTSTDRHLLESVAHEHSSPERPDEADASAE